MNAAMTARAAILLVVLRPTSSALASETPQATRAQPRVLASPTVRQRVDESTTRTANTQGGSVSASPTPVMPPEREMKSVLERIRALEADVWSLQAALAESRRENAAATSAMRSHHATLRDEIDEHKHFLDSGCIPSQTIAPNTDYFGCVYVHGQKGSTNPMTTAPIKYPH